jgi:hypothetical protein
MPKPIVQRSQRFASAARAERDRLARKRSQVLKKREDLQVRVDHLDEELAAVDREIEGLEALAAPGGAAGGITLVASEASEDAKVLKGAAIRALAVPLLLRTQGTAPIHYREWLGLLVREGYTVAGKRPDAVFLNQVARSPLVKATTRAGYYEIDLGAVDRLRQALSRQQSELAGLMREAPTQPGEAFDLHRERQRELGTALARTERELDEATAAVGAWQGADDARATEVRAA